jgi:hypothetical protein
MNPFYYDGKKSVARVMSPIRTSTQSKGLSMPDLISCRRKKVFYSAKRFSIASITVSKARIRAKRLQFPSIIVQGA